MRVASSPIFAKRPETGPFKVANDSPQRLCSDSRQAPSLSAKYHCRCRELCPEPENNPEEYEFTIKDVEPPLIQYPASAISPGTDKLHLKGKEHEWNVCRAGI